MPAITSRTAFKSYCQRKLGSPVIQINVSDDQIEDRIDDALEYYQDYHFDAVEDTYVPYYLYPRSSISKTPLRMSNSVGIIDAGYRGNLMASVDNVSGEDYQIQRGQRLFQICPWNDFKVTLEVVDELSDSDRGNGGFGSTGQ